MSEADPAAELFETESLLADAEPRDEGPALGSDPFAELDGPDPLAERLELLDRAWRDAQTRRSRARRAAPIAEVRADPRPADTAPLRVPSKRRAPVLPTLGEIELPEPRGLIDRFLGEDARRVLAAFSHLVENEGPYDRFGFSPEVTRRAFPFFQALYRGWFRVRSEGHANVPDSGPAVLVSNHAGLLPFDAAMTVIDLALHSDPPRLARAIVDRWAGTLPWINVFYARCGQVIGTRENFADLLDDGQLVLVYPEGVEGIRKTIAQRYRLQSFRVGFVEQALRSRAPIVPMAVIGSDDQAPILYDLKPLARMLGLPAAPITPTFPWLGPLGLLPYPVRYKIVYGEPLHFHERFGPEGAEDARLVRYLANQVRRTVQQLIDRSRS
ncbi:MAG TPA: lysophospholipid acyltransferase family protein [Myxococcota bacterium]|nr:lysophospholipid acyltransferase family protein [Myxococcota bacterium]